MTHEISPTEAARLYFQRMGIAQQTTMMQVAAKESLSDWAAKGDNFDGIARKFRTLEEEKAQAHKVKAAQKKEGLDADEEAFPLEEASSAEEIAYQFEKKNPEIKTKTLLQIRALLSEVDTPEEILSKVSSFYKDHSLLDEALCFLRATTQGALREKVDEAITLFRAEFGRQIIAGQNIYAESRAFSQEGLGDPSALRDLYRDVTGNIRTPSALFDELFSEYEYVKMETIIQFLLASSSADLRAKGPSIDPAELLKLVDDTKLLQAILGVYRFFQERMNQIHHQFTVYETPYPQHIGFELLAKAYLQLIKERYPSPSKFRDAGKRLQIYQKLAEEIIIFSQMRDALRQTSPRLYRDQKHKQSILQTWIDLLEDLEEEYEEEDL